MEWSRGGLVGSAGQESVRLTYQSKDGEEVRVCMGEAFAIIEGGGAGCSWLGMARGEGGRGAVGRWRYVRYRASQVALHGGVLCMLTVHQLLQGCTPVCAAEARLRRSSAHSLASSCCCPWLPQGFPGTVELSVTYTLTDDNQLITGGCPGVLLFVCVGQVPLLALAVAERECTFYYEPKRPLTTRNCSNLCPMPCSLPSDPEQQGGRIRNCLVPLAPAWPQRWWLPQTRPPPSTWRSTPTSTWGATAAGPSWTTGSPSMGGWVGGTIHGWVGGWVDGAIHGRVGGWVGGIIHGWVVGSPFMGGRVGGTIHGWVGG